MTKSARGGGTKDEQALAELERVLDHLQSSRFLFNVRTYGDATRRLEKQPIALDQKSEKHALAWTGKVDCEGNKAIWDVLQAVVSEPDIDTVFPLSSGEPEVGLYFHWNRVCEQLEHIALATGGTFKGVE